jgi:predicted O-methyltransferase YrrM
MTHNPLNDFDGLMPTERDVLRKLINDCSATRVLEIGMARATSTLAIFSALPPHGTVVSIDPFELRDDGYGGAGVTAIEEAGLTSRHSLIADYDYAALPRLVGEGQEFDFIFIDGYHALDYVMIDTFYSDLLLRVGGVLAFHDSGWSSVFAVCQFLETRKAYARIGPRPMLMRVSRSAKIVRLGWQWVTGRRAEASDRRSRWKSLAAYRKIDNVQSKEDDQANRYRAVITVPPHVT